MFFETDYTASQFLVSGWMHDRGQQMLFLMTLFVNVYSNVKVVLLNYAAFNIVLLLGYIYFLSNLNGIEKSFEELLVENKGLVIQSLINNMVYILMIIWMFNLSHTEILFALYKKHLLQKEHNTILNNL